MPVIMDIPGFEILEKIGDTRQTLAWKAKQLSLNRTVCLRVLKPELARDEAQLREFVDDARQAAELRHPNIVQIYDIAEHEDTVFLVMEHVSGVTLDTLMQKPGALPHKTALSIARSVAEALSYAWAECQLIHRNIKPENITIEGDGSVKLYFLGTARKVSPEQSAPPPSDTIEGTPHYMSPEQAQGAEDLNFHTDMYSLGTTLYYMLTGREPFGDVAAPVAMQRHIHEQLPNPRDVNAAVSPIAVQLLKFLLMKEPADRYASWTEAIEDINKALEGRIIKRRSRPDAVSTLAPLKSARRDSGRAGTRVPAWFRVPAWLLLLAWWGYFAYQRLHVTPHTPDIAPEPSPALRAPLAAPLPQADPEPEPEAEPPPMQEPPPPQATPAPPDVPPSPEPEPRATLADFKQRIADRLLQEDFPGALSLIQQALIDPDLSPHKDVVTAIRDMTKAAADIDELVAAAFKARQGERVVIFHNNEFHPFLVREVQGDTVQGVLKHRTSASGMARTVEFRISQLSPIERSRWLGEADSPRKAVMKYVLHMEAGDWKSALEFSAQCGPLSDIFHALAEARMAAESS